MTEATVSPNLTGWVDPRQLADWVHDARRRTIDLVDDLDDEQIMGPMLGIVNPPLWEIGHQAWFQELFVLRRLRGRSPIREDTDALYDSIAIPHDDRWQLPLPGRQETYRYMRQVSEAVAELLSEPDPSPELLYFTLYTVYHEDMHAEAFIYSRQTLGYPPPRVSGEPARPEGGGALPGDVEVPGGTFQLGASPEEPFVFDNEKWAHPVEVAPFAIARAPVTQAEFAAFVEDGGYRREELWSPEGWRWRQDAGAEHPLYWRRGPQGWERRHFDRWEPLAEHLPVVHVTFFEADAYCRWAGRRLPTEAEWEAAVAASPANGGLSERKRRYPWGEALTDRPPVHMDAASAGCAEVGALPEGDSPFGVRQALGNVWEWTSSTFGPYPGFERDPYEEYSEPWFPEGRKVLRGGAWATRSRMLRATWRNFFPAGRNDVFAGFRTCAS